MRLEQPGAEVLDEESLAALHDRVTFAGQAAFQLLDAAGIFWVEFAAGLEGSPERRNSADALGFGFGAIAYLVAWIVVREED